MKEAVMKVIDTLTQEDFHGAFQNVLEQYKCIAAGGDSFEVDKSFMSVLSIKVPIRKKVWKLISWSSYALGFLLYTKIFRQQLLYTRYNLLFLFSFYYEMYEIEEWTRETA